MVEWYGLPDDGHVERSNVSRSQEPLGRFHGQEGLDDFHGWSNGLKDLGQHCDGVKERSRLDLSIVESRSCTNESRQKGERELSR